MSGNDSQMTTPPPSSASEPSLCTNGCGFFGSGATAGMCSKCWRENMKSQEAAAATCPPAAPTPTEDSSSPMEVDTDATAPTITSTTEVKTAPSTTTTTSAATPLKKKKKKASYKSLMAGIVKTSSPERDVEKEKEQLRKVTGGGAFSKIDKI